MDEPPPPTRVLPLIDRYPMDAPLGTQGSRVLSAAGFVAAARALAATLPEAGCGLLLCQDRLAFALGLAAMLIRRATALLPPSQAPLAIADVISARSPGFALVDRPGVIGWVPERVVDPWSAWPVAGFAAEVPGIDADHVAAVVYTSGTTGAPHPHSKTWSSLVHGAHALRERLGFASGDALAGVVPPQHMWGLEASVMLPLQAGGLIHAAVPLLPEDIVSVLRELPQPRWLVLTPLHLRACVGAATRLPALRATLSATMPLDRRDAAAFESTTGAPLIEIYGSTETGVIGTRRPTAADAFEPLAKVLVTAGDAGLVVGGGHVEREVVLGDRVEVDAAGRFVLRGRDADLVKVGGKRASLAMLERTLASLPGVSDAAFVVLEQGATPRLAALVVAPGVQRTRLVAQLRERIDAVFLPRPLRLVDVVPRNALGKVSADVLRGLLARSSPSGEAISTRSPAVDAVRTVPATHPALPGHFPGRPIVPAALLVTLIESACREHLGSGLRSRGLVRARFRAPLLPGVAMRIELTREATGRVAFACFDGSRRLADGLLAVEETPT